MALKKVKNRRKKEKDKKNKKSVDKREKTWYTNQVACEKGNKNKRQALQNRHWTLKIKQYMKKTHKKVLVKKFE